MQIISHLRKNFNNIKQLNNEFVSTPPFPMIVLDNFLPINIARDMQVECESIANHYWSKFTRNGSEMYECKDLSLLPIAANFVNELHNQLGMTWLTQITGIKDLIPDPYLVGAGYSKIYKNGCLRIHTDFNWNETIKLHRMLSFIIYLNEDWHEEWGGNLEFKDFNNEKLVQNISPHFNRAVIWRYHKRGFHGSPTPVACPENLSRNSFRLFFYVSNAIHDSLDRPHRSLYWYDKENNEPYDIPTTH